MTKPIAAVTGATGFLGAHLLEALHAQGFQLRILARRTVHLPPHLRVDTQIISGDLASDHALERLVDGASVIIHSAGLTKALSKQAFMSVNRDGAQSLALAAQRRATGSHFILISSLAAREPQLSPYAASKRAGEEAVRSTFAHGRLTILRPPAIYGPGDRELLPLFKLASLPVIPLFGGTSSRVALTHVSDVVATIVALAAKPAYSQTETNLYSCGGDAPQGYNWREIFAAAAQAQDVESRFFQLPPRLATALLGAAGAFSETWAYLTGTPQVFTLGKAREMLHPDWSVPEKELPSDAFNLPATPLREGFERTISWYRREGWLAEKTLRVNDADR
jgi:nucleoside-diphosphate-sugar epimerase